jgi:S1-C subfamily serine protease
MGVVVLKLEPDSRAWHSGLREQDFILSINRVRIQSLKDVENVVARSSSGLLLKIRRGDSALFLAIR